MDTRAAPPLLDEIADHWLAPAFHLASHTGMRRGELLGLCWRDVDLDAARLSVHQAVLNVAYEKTASDVKTATGRRTIDLDPRTIDVLRTWRVTVEANAELTGRQLRADDAVFARPDGDAIRPTTSAKCLNGTSRHRRCRGSGCMTCACATRRHVSGRGERTRLRSVAADRLKLRAA